MRPYDILDVFTDTPLTGNPLAVVYEADGLSTERMQAITREFNLSETIFMHAAVDGRTPARIFTPAHEMPFAGHPTVGGSIALGLRSGTDRVALSLPAGPVDVTLTGDTVRRAEFDAPVLPTAEPLAVSAVDLARLLGLTPADIAGAAMRMSSGPAFTAIPLASVEALGRVRYDAAGEAALGDAPRAIYPVTPTAGGYQARMIALDFGIAEDPATGAAAVAFAAVALQTAPLGEGRHVISIAQGIEMGRPSAIELVAEVSGGALTRVRLAGEAVIVAQGTLLLD
ncbi:Phenazine biosynthesis PhzC/PhzF-like protein [Stappia sp. 22II-S9-Z10]|nr:Phenazine biosynthesis PhzC/PhzF-like protein [Stappia sp. 22II-S9-Z10]